MTPRKLYSAAFFTPLPSRLKSSGKCTAKKTLAQIAAHQGVHPNQIN